MSKRINSIDALRIIAAFFIICIHASYFGKEYVCYFAKCAVPVFFMISGYFFIGSKKESQLRSIKKIFMLVVLTNILFIFFKYGFSVFKHTTDEFFTKSFSLDALFNFFVLNESPFGLHLWFLSALLYCMIIAFFLSKIKMNKKILIPVICLLLLGDLCLGKYSVVVFGRTFSPLYARNFLFLGLPNFYIGSLFKEVSPDRIKIGNPALVGLIALFTATTAAEKYILAALDMSGVREHYISTTLLSLAVFALAVKNADYDKKGVVSFLANWGRKYSLFIYVFHILVYFVLKVMRSSIGIVNTICNYTEPFIIFAISLLAAVIYYKLKDLVIGKFSKKVN